MPTKAGGSQRKEEKMDGRGSAKAAEAVGKIEFEDMKSWMERRLAKLRVSIPNSRDPGGVAVVGDHGGYAVVADPGVIPVGEVAVGNLVGAAFAGDPLGEAVVFKTMPAPASKPFNGSDAMTLAAPFVFGLSAIQATPPTSGGAAFSFGTGAPSLFMHYLAALLANPPPSFATSFAFGAGSTAAAFGALAPAAFGSMPT
jgi:hypothetical protein